jgi:hypothetical protein
VRFAITKWSGGSGILVTADSEREARDLASEWIGDEPVAVRAVEDYVPPSRPRSSIPPSVASCTAKAREHTRLAFAALERREPGPSGTLPKVRA